MVQKLSSELKKAQWSDRGCDRNIGPFQHNALAPYLSHPFEMYNNQTGHASHDVWNEK